MRKRFLLQLSFFIYLVIFSCLLKDFILERSMTSFLTYHTCTTRQFREQNPTSGICKFINNKTNQALCKKYKPAEYAFLKKCYNAIWKDVIIFPVASEKIIFENTWQKNTSCMKNIPHDGTDLFYIYDKPGIKPVISMTDGTILSVIWKPHNQYSVFISGSSGGIYYYSFLVHPENYVKNGETVRAGDILGYMGQCSPQFSGSHTAFSKLHIGIYIKDHKEQYISINPYWVLESVKKKLRKYTY